METPFKLVQNKISHDTVKAAKTIVADAENGDCIGFAITAMYRHGNYTVNTTGEAYKSPTFAIGMVIMLLYELIKSVIRKQGKT